MSFVEYLQCDGHSARLFNFITSTHPANNPMRQVLLPHFADDKFEG